MPYSRPLSQRFHYPSNLFGVILADQMPEQCPSCGEWALYEESDEHAECANCGVIIELA